MKVPIVFNKIIYLLLELFFCDDEEEKIDGKKISWRKFN